MATYAKLQGAALSPPPPRLAVSGSPPPEDGTPCPRCGAPFSVDGGCAGCGLPPTPADDELVRQDRFLAFALRCIAEGDDPTSRLHSWRKSVEARLQDAQGAGRPAILRAQDAARLAGERQLDLFDRAGAADDDAVEREGVPEQAEPATESVPPATPALQDRPRRPVARRQPGLSAQELLARRLEIGVWFVGALLAVGGSLLATRLFWGQLPEAIRPGIVAAGLALFAGAFVAAGSQLAARYPGSSAGSVLGLVGRLFAISATVPLGSMRHDDLPSALGFLALALALVAGGMALALKRGVAGVTRSGSLAVLAGMGLLFLAPRSELIAAAIVGLGVVLVKLGLSLRTRRALLGESTWLEDAGAAFVGLAVIVASCVSARPALGEGPTLALLAAGVALFVDALVVALESRAMGSGYRALVRLLGAALVATSAVVASLHALEQQRDFLYAGLTLLSLSLVVRRRVSSPASAWLYVPSWTLSSAAVLLFALAALELSRVNLDGGLRLALVPALLWLFVVSFAARRERGPAPRPPSWLSGLLLAATLPAALVVGELGPWCAPSLALALALFVTDRRAERSVLFNLVGGLAGVLAVLAALDGLRAFHGLALGSATAAVGAVLLVLATARKKRATRQTLAATSALCLLLLATGGLALVTDGLGQDALVPVLVAGALLLVVGEISRALALTLCGAGLLWGLALVRHALLVEGGPLRVTAFAAVALAALSLLPPLRGRPVRLLRRGLSPLGHSRYARAGALSLLAAASAALSLPAVFGGWWTRPAPALEASFAALAMLALFVRTRGAVALAGLVAFSVVAAADAGVVLAELQGPGMATALAGLSAVALWSLALVVLRATGAELSVVRGWRRRRGAGVPAASALWPLVGLLGVVGLGLGVVVSPPSLLVLDEAMISQLVLHLAEVLALSSLVALLLFAVSGRQALVVVATAFVGLALAVQAPRVLDVAQQTLGLGVLVGLTAWLALLAVLARAAYRGALLGGERPVWLAAWPRPAALRGVAYAGLCALAGALLLVGASLRLAGNVAQARLFAPGVIVLVAAVIVASLVVATRHRTTPALFLVGALIGVTATAFELSVRAAGWLPPPTGLSQALGAWGLVALLLLLDRRRGRRLLVALGFGLPRAVRERLVGAASVAAWGLVGFAVIRASLGAPQLHVETLVIGALALVAIALVAPRRGTAAFGAVGITLASAAVAARALAFATRQADLAVETLPVVLSLALAGALVTERFAYRLASSRAARRWHAHRRAGRRAAGPAARFTAQRLGTAALFGQLALCLLAPPTTLLGMAGLGASLVLGVVLVARLAYGFATERSGHGLLPLACFAMVLAAVSLVTGERTLLEFIERNEDMLGLAGVSWFLVVALWLAARRSGRWVLASVGMPLPRKNRRVVVAVLQIGVVFFAGLALLRGAAGYPFVPLAPSLLVALAPAALLLLVPTRLGTALAPVGLAALFALGAVAVADAALVRPVAVELSTGPLALVTVLVVCLALQTLGPRLFASDVVRRFYGTSSSLASLGEHLKLSAELLAGAALFGVIALSAADSAPGPLALASTWIALGVALVLFSRVAVDREQTVWAAVAQGAALAVYVDLRRRTPWLDDVYAVDAMACLAGAVLFVALRSSRLASGRRSPIARAAELYAATLPVLAALLGPSQGTRALVLAACGGVYAVLARSRRHAAYEIGAGLALVFASLSALVHYEVKAPELYLMPIAFVGTFLARRHRGRFGVVGRYLAVGSQIPAYVTAAWSALGVGTFTAFALGVGLSTAGLLYAFRARDRRSLYAAVASVTVLVTGRLILAGLENALLGTLLLVGLGVALLAGMTAFTIKRESAGRAYRSLVDELGDWRDG